LSNIYINPKSTLRRIISTIIPSTTMIIVQIIEAMSFVLV
jgi:hypothetical protein